MNGNSKREKVHAFIKRAIYEGLAEAAIRNHQHAEWLGANRGWLASNIIDQALNGYRLKELQDIMDWKQKDLRD